MGSERGFGLVFAVVFVLVGLWPAVELAWRPRLQPEHLRLWALALAAAFLATALLHPPVLRPLNRLWFLLGMLLSRIMTPLVMGLLFVLAVVPTAIVMRLRGHDLLRLKIDRNARTYWIVREPPGPPRDSMRQQY